MTTIRILPDLLANKIAAGEVVERPASVVKELVENALDAGGNRILIEIENGGRSLIQVADNGSGMGQDDALLCLERFATSKLYDESGLSAIDTLGFRGEALPSIAAVSKMTLISRRHQDTAGVQVSVHGGKILSVQEAGAAVGTLIKVSQLFFNTPARRKFLKNISTEMNHIADTVAGLALGRPQVHFDLSHNGKTVYQWPRTDARAQRTAQVLGRTTAPDLIALDVQQKGITINGYLGPTRMARTTSRGCYVFINGRRVHDRVVQHALFEGYRGRLIKGRFPLAVLDIRLPFDQVDINVHPTKHEIRFAEPQTIHTVVQSAVAAALDGHERRLWATTPPDNLTVSGVAQMPPSYPSKPLSDIVFNPPMHQRAAATPAVIETRPDLRIMDTGADVPVAAVKATQPQAPRFSDLKVIGQFNGMYIVCQAPDGLILIDQHAAHERIVYEALKPAAGRLPSQRLLLPATVDLSFVEAQALEGLLPELGALGLEIEPFGGTTFAVRSVPSVLNIEKVESMVVELAEKQVELGPGAGLEGMIEQSRMVMACHKAIRANQRLESAEILALLTKLDLCRDPSHCPHGRPTWIRWSMIDLAKAFGRA